MFRTQNCSIFGDPAVRLMIFCRGDLHIIIVWVAAIPCRLHVKACQSTIGLNQTQGPKVNPNNTLLRTGLLLTYCNGATFGGEGRWNLHDSWIFRPLQFTHRPVARIVFATSSPCESMTPRCHAVAPPPPQPCGSLPWRHGTLPATCLPARLPRAALPLRLQQARREGFGTRQALFCQSPRSWQQDHLEQRAKVEAHAILVSSSSMNGATKVGLSPESQQNATQRAPCWCQLGRSCIIPVVPHKAVAEVSNIGNL